jgi:hypothetical protein
MAPWSQGASARPFPEPNGAHIARHVCRIIDQTGAVCVENFGGRARDRSGREGHQPVSPQVPKTEEVLAMFAHDLGFTNYGQEP